MENLQREDLNPIEEAQGYGLLIDAFQLTQEEVATRVGKSRAAVANALRLLKLDEDVQTHVRQGQLATGHAKVILGLDDAAQQKLAADRRHPRCPQRARHGDLGEQFAKWWPRPKQKNPAVRRPMSTLQIWKTG